MAVVGYSGFELRKAQRNADCRFCRGSIQKGDHMLTGYSSSGRGMYMHFHPECVKRMYIMVEEHLAKGD